jgi:hypothetical protein
MEKGGCPLWEPSWVDGIYCDMCGECIHDLPSELVSEPGLQLCEECYSDGCTDCAVCGNIYDEGLMSDLYLIGPDDYEEHCFDENGDVAPVPRGVYRIAKYPFSHGFVDKDSIQWVSGPPKNHGETGPICVTCAAKITEAGE